VVLAWQKIVKVSVGTVTLVVFFIGGRTILFAVLSHASIGRIVHRGQIKSLEKPLQNFPKDLKALVPKNIGDLH
jgi:hypothetical protein